MPEQEWFTVVEVAQILKVSRDTIIYCRVAHS